MVNTAEKFPGFELEELLHASSVNAIYRAVRLADGVRVVLKCAQRGQASAQDHTRARNEYELLRSLESEHVIHVHDLVAAEGRVALVLEDFAGYPLKRWLADEQHSLEDRLRIAIDLSRALSEVHAASIIHKDINPHNVVYDPEAGRCKLIDFGIATRLRSEESAFRMPSALEGTLAYIAPEQTGRMNRRLDYRADLYSLGVTLYELFSRRLPHETSDPVEAVHFHIAGKPPPLGDVASDVPPTLAEIVMKLLQKAPEQRYQSAAGVAADLEVCLERLDSGGALEPFELATKDVIDRFEPPQKLYGREAEVQKLLETFQRVAGGGVEASLIAGPAGIGKTSLVQEIHQAIAERRGYFAAGKFDQLNRGTPFSALVAALQGLVEQLLTESEEAVAAWRDEIRAALAPNGRVIVDVVPMLELIIGPQPDVPELEPFEAQNRFNHAFQRFIQVFGSKSHPLVLFLDDMQWADQASLNLLSVILTASATESLLVVAAYRDNEVTPTHPFMLAMQELDAQGVGIGRIELGSLGPTDVGRLVADALRVDAARAAPLAEILEARTLGNPFFMRQFLEMLHAEKLIRFDPDRGGFDYDPEAVSSAAISENVAELLAAKLNKLPPPTQNALRMAAAIGNRFDLETLALISGRSQADTAGDLGAALRAGLVVPQSRLEVLDASSLDSPLVYRRFRFLHDRVQQAAYAAIAVEERPALHLTIGRTLLQDAGEQLDARLFDIVNHMQRGAALIEDAEERLTLGRLCVQAGKRARKSTAYSLAIRCFEHAVEQLGPGAWTSSYELIYDATSRLAESLCLNAENTRALTVIDEAFEHATALDRARLCTLGIVVRLSIGDMPAALACGRRALELFGVSLPSDDAEIDSMLESEIASILEKTSSIGIERLIDLPRMDDPVRIATMESLMHCLPAAFQSDQRQYALICCKMVLLSLEHGNCPLSARAYSSFAALLSSVLGDYEGAYRFARLGVDLAHKLEDPAVLSSVYFLLALFSSHWVRPIEESIEEYRRSIQHGLETGDHQHAGYGVARRIAHRQFRGVELAELVEDTRHGLDQLHRIGDEANIEFLPPRLRLMQWLRGERPHGDTLATDSFDEAALTAAFEARGNRSFESDWYVQLTTLHYLAGDYTAALAFAEKSETLIPFSAGFVTRVEHTFYYSLILAALIDGAQPADRERYAAKLDSNLEQLAVWAASCPENYSQLALLARAEHARVTGSVIEAMTLYDEALADAAAHGFVNFEALAAEHAARFWASRNKRDFAELYLARALAAYEVWGAHGRVEDLRKLYQQAPSGPATSAVTSKAGSEHVDALDLATVLKANQVISGEIVLERLLATLIDIILENAGAESAALILDSGGEFLIQGLNAGGRTRVMGAEPLTQTVAVSRGIVNYVIRTREHVVLSNPAERGRFRNDGYVRNRRPKSVLCAPIVHKGQLKGVIYLENNQVAGAFTPDRHEALNILLGQIAVSLENAMLYQQQELQTRAIEQANVALKNEVVERRRAEEELEDYKDHLEDLVKQRTEELESAQGRLVDLSRRAGMAEVASGVLHNVGNVMNSVNVGASMVRDALRGMRAEGLGAVCDLLDEHAESLGDYLQNDPAGRKVPLYLRKLGEELAKDKQSILGDIDHVLEHLDHMKRIVAAQQTYAKTAGFDEVCELDEIVDAALQISPPPIGVKVERDFAELPPVVADRHQILQILVNLISNARHALADAKCERPTVRVRVAREGRAVVVAVSDNGVGIGAETLRRVFNHGFTTKADGHGFGLHNCANAAQRMGGSLEAHSAGPGKGATFTLRLPMQAAPGADRPEPATAAEAP